MSGPVASEPDSLPETITETLLGSLELEEPFPGHLLWRERFVHVTKSPDFVRLEEWLAVRFRVCAGVRKPAPLGGPTREVPIGLTMS